MQRGLGVRTNAGAWKWAVLAPLAWAGLALVGLAGPAAAENWPQWRGASHNGVSTEQNLPAEFGKDKAVVWKTPVPGPAGATPVVWGDRIFLTSADGQDLVLACYGTDGKPQWKEVIASGNQQVRGDEGNSASPSPMTDGEHVWAFFTTGDLVCYTAAGKLAWKLNLQDRYGKFNIAFGMTSTPILDGDQLYFQLIHTNGAHVVCLKKSDGAEVWHQQRPSDARDECEHSYASPTLYRDDKQAFLITHGADYVIGHDLKTGAELWRCGGMNPKDDKYNPTLRFVASPVSVPGLIVVPSAKNGPVLGLLPDAKGDVTGTKSAFQWRREDNTPDVPSPLVHDGLVYLCRENGVLICLDAKTGEEYYQKRVHSDRYRASPLYADGKIYLASRDGTISVVKAGKTFEQLATNALGEEISSSPVVSNGRLYVRTFEHLWAFGAK